MTEKTSQEEVVAIIPSQHYNAGVIQHKVSADKYTGVITDKYEITCAETGAKFSIKSSVMTDMARLNAIDNTFSMLVRNGYEGSGRMNAGAGLAVKMTRTKDVYECIFYTGEIGKSFDSKKIMGKDYISLDEKHLSALFTFLLCDEAVSIKLDQAKRLANSSLELN